MISARPASNSSSARPGRRTLITQVPSGTPSARRSPGVGSRAVITSSGPACTVIFGGTDLTKLPAPLRVSIRPSSRSTATASRAVDAETS